MTDLKDGIERNVAQTSVWSRLRVSSYAHHYRDRDVLIEGLDLRHSGTDGALLLGGCDLSLLHGRCYGLIGRNGVGKTTLMRHIAEHRILGLPAHLRCVYIDDESHQIGMIGGSILGAGQSGTVAATSEGEESQRAAKLEHEGQTALDYLLSQHTAQIATQRALKEALDGDAEADVDAVQSACDALAFLEADKAEGRATAILESLDIDPSAPLASLSGGWLHRASLAAALFVESDILLLDEPTNHLDIYGIAWLEQYLQSLTGEDVDAKEEDRSNGGAAKAARKDAMGRQQQRRKRSHPPIVVVISHDFNFLDSVCTNILNFENGSLEAFGGNYSRFLETRQAKLAKHTRMYKAQERRRREMTTAIERLQQRAAANPTAEVGGQIKARQKHLKSRLGASLDGTYWKYGLMGPRPEILAPVAAEPISLNLTTDVSDVPEGHGKGETLLVRIADGVFDYPEEGCNGDGADAEKRVVGEEKRTYAEDGTPLPASSHADGQPASSMFPQLLNISLTLSSRVAFVGRNGTGKSTILKLLAGHLRLLSGDRLAWGGLRSSFLSQHSITAAGSGADGNRTPLEFILAQHGSGSDSPARRADAVRLLQQFGVHGLLAEESRMAVLSAGQRARVLLANALFCRPHVLLLDEPTSHLDAETASALSEGLEAFEGAVVVASHDVTFIENLGGALYCTDEEAFGWYPHPIATYHSALLSEKRRIDRALATESANPTTTTAAAPSAVAAPAARITPANPPPPALAPPAGGAPAARGVGCRFCGGNHFSHSCPDKPADAPKPQVMSDNYDNTAWRYANQPAAKPKAAPVALPKMAEKATDGGGDWKVAVSKSTLKRLKKGV